MKKPITILFILTLSILLLNTLLLAAETRAKAPRVVYTAPDDESVVDLTGKKVLRFEWKNQPVPAGGRASYKITIYKGFGYDVVFSEDIDPKTFLIDIPAEKFEDSTTYSWHVKQRDAGTSQWSRFESWSFKVIKKQ